jgi:hypothetical protein
MAGGAAVRFLQHHARNVTEPISVLESDADNF